MPKTQIAYDEKTLGWRAIPAAAQSAPRAVPIASESRAGGLVNTKAEVLSVLPGNGWHGRYKQGRDKWEFSPIVAFLILRHSGGRIETVGLVNDEKRIGKGERADSYSNFDGYARA